MSTKKDGNFESAEEIREQVRRAVKEGGDIAGEVERLTREALEMGRIEFRQLQSVIESIGRGASAGASEQPDDARKQVSEAFEGLQNALLHAFESARLAFEEQASRAGDLYENELKTQLQQLQRMETTMLDSLGKAARAGTSAGTAALDDMVRHARRSGTRLGEEVEQSLRKLSTSLPAALGEMVLAGMSAAREATARATEVASGVLSGVADTLHKDGASTGEKGPDTDGKA